jgi:hypothetical protein
LPLLISRAATLPDPVRTRANIVDSHTSSTQESPTVPTAKATWFYEFSDYGWSESLWRPYSTSLSEVIPTAEAYASSRMKLMGNGVALPAIRVSDDAVYRDSIYSLNSYITGAAADGVFLAQGGNLQTVKGALPAQVPASIFECVQTRMEGTSLYRREMMVRGLPQPVMTNPPGPLFQGAFLEQWNAWVALVMRDWSFRCKSRADASALKTVTTVTIGPPSTVTVPGAGYAVGDRIQLLGFRNVNGIRGKYYVESNVGGVLTLLGFTPLQTVLQPIGYAQLIQPAMQAPSINYQAITAVKAITQTHRKTGRPSFGPRGRVRGRA